MKEYGLDKINSFLLAVAVYAFIIILIFLRLVTHVQPAIQYTDIQDSFIDIELMEPSKKVVNEQSAPKDIQKPAQELDIEKPFARTTSKAVKTEDVDQKASNFNELFGSIKEIQEEKATKTQSSAKSETTSDSKTQASELVKQLDDSSLEEENINQDESIRNQKTGIYDEFLGKVVHTTTQGWKQYHPNSENISVKVKILIDENGNFGYTSVEKGGNSLYDVKVAEFLENQKGRFIAYPPQSKSISITISLKDEAQIQK